jgi:hypothetical protein
MIVKPVSRPKRARLVRLAKVYVKMANDRIGETTLARSHTTAPREANPRAIPIAINIARKSTSGAARKVQGGAPTSHACARPYAASQGSERSKLARQGARASSEIGK